MEDCLWKKQIETKLNSLARIVSEPIWYQETSHPNAYHYPPIYSNYFRVEVNESGDFPIVEILIRDHFREHYIELFNEILKLTSEKLEYEEIIKEFSDNYSENDNPYTQTTLFVTKEELKQLDNQIVITYLKKKSSELKFNCVLLGQPDSGRTTMIFTMGYGEIPEYIPGVYGNFELDCLLGKDKVCLELWDTHCAPDYDRLRPLCYPVANLCCVCFSVCSFNSLQMAIVKFIPEIRKHKGFSVPIVLIGCRIDQRDMKFSNHTLKSLHKPITFEEGEDIARRTGCITYIETSSFKKIGLDDFLPVCVKSLVAWHLDKSSSEKKKNCQVQ